MDVNDFSTWLVILLLSVSSHVLSAFTTCLYWPEDMIILQIFYRSYVLLNLFYSNIRCYILHWRHRSNREAKIWFLETVTLNKKKQSIRYRIRSCGWQFIQLCFSSLLYYNRWFYRKSGAGSTNPHMPRYELKQKMNLQSGENLSWDRPLMIRQNGMLQNLNNLPYGKWGFPAWQIGHLSEMNKNNMM